MAFLFPRAAAFTPFYGPTTIRCGGPVVRHEAVVPQLWSLFDDTFAELQRAATRGGGAGRRQFNPRFDVRENREAYTLEGELPGIDQKDISIEFLDETTLQVKGRTESHTESGRRPDAVESATTKAVEDGAVDGASPAAQTESVKSHRATVEDEEPTSGETSQAVTETSKPTDADAATAPQQESKTPAAETQHWVSERFTGEFSRQFNFPSRVDQDRVTASLKNGLLSVIVPKAPAPASRRVNIE